MDVAVELKVIIKDLPKEVVMLGTESMKDCLKIIFADGLKKNGYSCEISEINIESVEK